jgi:hypothetical protein
MAIGLVTLGWVMLAAHSTPLVSRVISWPGRCAPQHFVRKQTDAK